MNDYKLYLDNCANRTVPLGETSGSIESDNYLWETGVKCTENSEELSNFRVYTMDKAINETLDEDLGKVGTDTTTPTDVIPSPDISTLYDDSTYVECAAGTTDAGIGQGYDNGTAKNIHLCSLPNTLNAGDGHEVKVNARVSASFFALMEQLKVREGTDKVKVFDGYRTMAQQEYFWCRYTFPVGTNNGEPESDYSCGSTARGGGNQAAFPGTSNHQMGLAIDFALETDSQGRATKPRDEDYIYDWLTDNAATYGVYKLSTEAWHWQIAR